MTCYLGMPVGNEGCNYNTKSHQKVHAFLEAHELHGGAASSLISLTAKWKKGMLEIEHVF